MRQVKKFQKQKKFMNLFFRDPYLLVLITVAKLLMYRSLGKYVSSIKPKILNVGEQFLRKVKKFPLSRKNRNRYYKWQKKRNESSKTRTKTKISKKS